MAALRSMVALSVAEFKLCNEVFDTTYSESAFNQIVGKSMANLLELGHALVKGKRAYDKVG